MALSSIHEIKWCHRPFATIQTTLEMPPIKITGHLKPYEYFTMYITPEMFDLKADNTNIYALQSGTMGFKHVCLDEIGALIGLHILI